MYIFKYMHSNYSGILQNTGIVFLGEWAVLINIGDVVK